MVCRPDHPTVFVKQLPAFLAAVGVVAERDCVHVDRKEVVSELRSDSLAGSNILTVDNHEARSELTDQPWEQCDECITAGAADDISYEEDSFAAHEGNSTGLLWVACVFVIATEVPSLRLPVVCWSVSVQIRIGISTACPVAPVPRDAGLARLSSGKNVLPSFTPSPLAADKCPANSVPRDDACTS
ncbi:unannotated protein [freshwater metagenome]|uniref:Unannotated protein n=1 Tax=freshwater metagenome TaxID=449393 RepID=A0A6J7E787_9ZZZZ